MLKWAEVPWRADYNYGVGVDLISGCPMGRVVNSDHESIPDTGGSHTAVEVSRVDSTEDLEKRLGIDAEATYGAGLFGQGVAARLSYVKDCAVQKSSLFIAVTAKVKLKHISIPDPQLTDEAKALAADPDRFAQRYGNMFVRGIVRGGLSRLPELVGTRIAGFGR